MTIKEILSSIIRAKAGQAVAEQFEKSWSDIYAFENQNINALRKIYAVLDHLVRRKVFSDRVQAEIEDHCQHLREYFHERGLTDY